MDTPKITCLVLVYNEEKKIRSVISHALKWADEVLIVDKSSSDQTAAIAREMGARVETVPFSKQGNEDSVSVFQMATHDWVWAFTASEMPTSGLIEAGKKILAEQGGQFDVVCVPFVYFSFGIHNVKSPWGLSSQPRITHKTRAMIQSSVHEHVICNPLRTTSIQFAPGCYAIHQTHGGVESFMTSHLAYMQAEATKPDPQAQITKALAMAGDWEANFKSDPELFPQHLAWKIYWYGVALHCWEKMIGGDFSDEYRARAEAMLKSQWLS